MQQAPDRVRTFYRITRANPPTLQDFLSNTAKRRRPPRDDPEILRLWAGISVFDTEESARQQARRFPAIGRFIAGVQILERDPVQYQQTGSDPHHHTLWAAPAILLAHVVSSIPV